MRRQRLGGAAGAERAGGVAAERYRPVVTMAPAMATLPQKDVRVSPPRPLGPRTGQKNFIGLALLQRVSYSMVH